MRMCMWNTVQPVGNLYIDRWGCSRVAEGEHLRRRVSVQPRLIAFRLGRRLLLATRPQSAPLQFFGVKGRELYDDRARPGPSSTRL